VNPTAEFTIAGKVALVSGGAGAIGGAIGARLAAAGMAVALMDRDADNVAQRAVAIARDGRRCRGWAGDVTDAAAVRRVVNAARSAYGPIDVLVNAAGIFPRSEVAELSEDEWDRVLDVNLKAAFLLSREVLPDMVGRRQGRIISIGSDLGHIGVPGGAHYAASKAGLHALTRSLAKEVGMSGVTVNCVLPGLVDTPMMRASNAPEYIEAYTRRAPDQRLGEPDDCAGLVAFLASTDARYMTGQLLGLRSGL
jgi:NAD(P)-dependent dehydrogenase (short-subunit alcohol dehydrogenase family)